MTPLPLTLGEADFSRTVIDYALHRGWHIFHALPAMTSRGQWVTATQGHPGWPDLALARDGVFMAAELKRQHGRLRPGQHDWLTALGEHGRLWRPSDWNHIVEELR